MIPLKVMPKMQHMSVSLVISGFYLLRQKSEVGFKFMADGIRSVGIQCKMKLNGIFSGN